MSTNILATVFIPVFNGENEYLEYCLKAVCRQKTHFAYKILIIDSGSTDNSVKIIKKYQDQYNNITLVEIPNSEFSHGRTRQKAAEIAEGDFIVYLTQDAIPANENWLSEMLKPFYLNKKIVGVVGKQTPRYNCFPLQKYDIQSVFATLGVQDAITVYTNNSNPFYSDVNSAARRNVLLSDVPYRDIEYSEDMMFSKDLFAKGYYKAYTSKGAVIHSNDIKLKDYEKRVYDEVNGLMSVGYKFERPSVGFLIRHLIWELVLGNIKIMRDRGYSFKRRLFFIFVNPIYFIERWRGQRRALTKTYR